MTQRISLPWTFSSKNSHIWGSTKIRASSKNNKYRIYQNIVPRQYPKEHHKGSSQINLFCTQAKPSSQTRHWISTNYVNKLSSTSVLNESELSLNRNTLSEVQINLRNELKKKTSQQYVDANQQLQHKLVVSKNIIRTSQSRYLDYAQQPHHTRSNNNTVPKLFKKHYHHQKR